jgi:hypothetical protein
VANTAGVPVLSERAIFVVLIAEIGNEIRFEALVLALDKTGSQLYGLLLSGW